MGKDFICINYKDWQLWINSWKNWTTTFVFPIKSHFEKEDVSSNFWYIARTELRFMKLFMSKILSWEIDMHLNIFVYTFEACWRTRPATNYVSSHARNTARLVIGCRAHKGTMRTAQEGQGVGANKVCTNLSCSILVFGFRVKESDFYLWRHPHLQCHASLSEIIR